MREQVNFSESAGRTIEAVEYDSDNALVTFSDGTFAVIGVVYGWEGEGEMCDEEIGNPLYEYGSSLLLRMGIATQEDIDAEEKRKADEKVRRAVNEELKEKAEFERLKRKYGT